MPRADNPGHTYIIYSHIDIRTMSTTPSTYKLLSLPPDLVRQFNTPEQLPEGEWFATSDPAGCKVGSGGGTAWLLRQWLESDPSASLSRRKIIIHAGGQSRRLPSYAPVGKILTPVPVFRWARGQKLTQNLLQLQLPLYQRIIENAPSTLNTLIASGDVLVRAGQANLRVPEADVVCFGIWVDAELASHHGVFASPRSNPEVLDFMLQKPSVAEMEHLAESHLFLMDIGIWLLSDRAVEMLMKRSTAPDGAITYYDLYSDFGRALGQNPTADDPEVAQLSVAVVPLHDGEFYHFGTSRELISSTLALQHRVLDQRKILQRKIKPSQALFVQNALMGYRLSEHNDRVWVENSNVPAGWNLKSDHIITGVPCNDWHLDLPAGICLDIVPVGETGWAVRPYGIDDPMRGAVGAPGTRYIGQDFIAWAAERSIDLEAASIPADLDIQSAPIFPVVQSTEEMETLLRFMLTMPDDSEGRRLWIESPRLSADGISASANLTRLYSQRAGYRRDNWTYLADNYRLSVFYQLDLADAAEHFNSLGLDKPATLTPDAPAMTRIRNHMLRSRIDRLRGADGNAEEQAAFSLLRSEILNELADDNVRPRLSVYPDQIVWGRSSVRIDLAGGWTDTPPYSLFSGGNVVNFAIELNGQPPLQVYVKPASEPCITLRSIDMGAVERIDTFEQLQAYHTVGSPFSIPKAALTLAGFTPRHDAPTLRECMREFGCGLELTLLAAIPAGSGLGTSSILGSTVLGALSDFCGLGWNENEICRRTLALEQLLTTGGGWQDQYGGALPGVKLLQTAEGYDQRPVVSWLPDQIFTAPELRPCHLLYYTGMTRTAKEILADIVRGMFLNSGSHLQLLDEMKAHAIEMAQTIQHGNFNEYGRMIAETWRQNKLLDAGTEPAAVAEMIRRVEDYTIGAKLPGAGGGGYLYMVAKDPEAAARIRSEFTACPPNPRARFVDMRISDTGFQVSRS